MKKNTVLICVAIMLAASSGLASENKKITIVDSSWLPYYGQFLPNYGIVPEIVAAAYGEMGYEVDFSFMSWSRALDAVKTGDYDAVATASFTEERAKNYLYSDPFLESPIVFFKQKEDPISWKKLEDLKPYKICVMKGYSYSPEFDKADFLRKVAARSEVLSFKKLFYKQADLIIMDQLVGNYVIREKLFGREKHAFDAMPTPLHADKLHLMFTKVKNGSLENRKVFNKGLGIIREKGKFDEILAGYGLK